MSETPIRLPKPKTDAKPQCRPNCLLDCPYCHRHVIDVYGHLKHNPCQAAAQA